MEPSLLIARDLSYSTGLPHSRTCGVCSDAGMCHQRMEGLAESALVLILKVAVVKYGQFQPNITLALPSPGALLAPCTHTRAPQEPSAGKALSNVHPLLRNIQGFNDLRKILETQVKEQL